MKALSVRAPWWYAILYLGKRIENRDWYTNVRGTVYLHASSWWVEKTVREDWRHAVALHQLDPLIPFPAFPTIESMRARGGCIVGKIDIVDCVNVHTSVWYTGNQGFTLANPLVLYPAIPYRGERGFFNVPDDLETR